MHRRSEWLCPHDGLSTEQRAAKVAEKTAAARAAIRQLRADRVLDHADVPVTGQDLGGDLK